VRSVQALREKGMDVKHDGHAAAMEWFSAEQYSAACTAAGLRPTTVELLRVDMTRQALIDIGRFSLFIEGALPGVPSRKGPKHSKSASSAPWTSSSGFGAAPLAGSCCRSGVVANHSDPANSSSIVQTITL